MAPLLSDEAVLADKCNPELKNIVYASKELQLEDIDQIDNFEHIQDCELVGVLCLEESTSDIPQAVLNFRANGIKVWLFSADDDVSIAKRSGIQKHDEPLFYLTNLNTKSDILFRISKYRKGMLVLDG